MFKTLRGFGSYFSKDHTIKLGFYKGSGYFAIWRQNSRYASAKIALSLTLTQTLTQTLTLIPTLNLTLTQTLTEEKHYFASKGKIATSFYKWYWYGSRFLRM